MVIGDNVLKIYGISNCDTIKKARRWLDSNGLEYDFHDYRKDGLDLVSLANWAEELGWEQLLNRRGTTWRKLPEEVKASINKERALELMLEQPAMIKRPLLDTGATKILGFSEKQYSHLLS